MKLRAIIEGIEFLFTLQELAKCAISTEEDICIVKDCAGCKFVEITKWLAAGKEPDRFTGLQDCNGVDIYENDILMDVSPDIPTRQLVKIVQNQERALFELQSLDGEFESYISFDESITDFKVIGNTHTQNKEFIANLSNDGRDKQSFTMVCKETDIGEENEDWQGV